MTEDSRVKIRPATLSDKEFILSLVPRLAEFGPPAWRDAEQMTDFDRQVISGRMDDPSPDVAIFVAEDVDGTALGFIHLHAGEDYYYSEEHGHIGDIIVAREGEGRGVGRLLMQQAEMWARSRGYRWLTLSVFAQNHRAREVYQHLGYGEDVIKYVKELD